MNNLSNKLKEFRKKNKMSQEDLANASGINLSSIKKYETGLRCPKTDQLNKLAKALNISPNELQTYQINNEADVASIIINLKKSCDLNIEIEKDETGNYIPGSLKFSFNNQKINQLIAEYLKQSEVPIKLSPDTERYSYDTMIDGTPITIDSIKINE